MTRRLAIVWNPSKTDRDALADDGGVAALVEGAVVADVDDGAVLDVAARTDPHVVHIPADHRPRPDRDVIAQHHIADDGAGRIDVDAFAEHRQLVEEGADRGHA